MSFLFYEGVMIPLIKPLSREERGRLDSNIHVNYEGTLIYVLEHEDFVHCDRHEVVFLTVPCEEELVELKTNIPVACDFGKALRFHAFHFDTVDSPLDECTLDQFGKAYKEVRKEAVEKKPTKKKPANKKVAKKKPPRK